MLLRLIVMSLLFGACASGLDAGTADRSASYAVAIVEACGGPCPAAMAIAMDWSDEGVRAAIEDQLGRTVTVGIPHSQQIDFVGLSEARLSSNGRALVVRIEVVRGSDNRQEDVLLVPEGGSWRVVTPTEVDVTVTSSGS